MKSPEQPFEQESFGLSKIDTSLLIEKLTEYNKQFSWGASAARQMMSVMPGEDNEDEGLGQQTADEILSFENMKIDAKDMLEATGLEFVPVKSGIVLVSSEGNHEFKEMRLNLVDGAQFVKYLCSLNQEGLSDSQKEGLKQIAEVLTKQFRSYDLNDPENASLLELMGNMSKIIDEYKRLGDEFFGSDESILSLENYLTYARKGCLREYMEAEKLKLNKPFIPGKYILEWHKDATKESLQKSWDEVIDVLQMIYKNKNAEAIYAQALATAKQALESAFKQVTEWQSDPKQKKYADKLLPVIVATKARIGEF